MPKTMNKEELYAADVLTRDAQLRVAAGLAARDELQRREEIIALARRLYICQPTDDREMEWAVWQLMATGALKKEDTFFYVKCAETDAYLVHSAEQIEAIMKERKLSLKAMGELLPLLNSTALQKLTTISANDRRRRIEEMRVYSIFEDPIG